MRALKGRSLWQCVALVKRQMDHPDKYFGDTINEQQ
jgi:hypothetical protein